MLKVNRFSLLLMGLVVSILNLNLAAFSGVSPAAQANQPQPPQPVVSSEAASPVQGRYITRISVKDVHPQMQGDLPASGEYKGAWEIQLGKDGKYTTNFNGVQIVAGRYSTNSEKITFWSGQWASNCLPANEGAGSNYYWTSGDKALKLDATSETCAVRWLVLTSHPLTLLNRGKVNKPGFQPQPV